MIGRALLPVLVLLALLVPAVPRMAAADQRSEVARALAAAGQDGAVFTLPSRPLPPCTGALTAAPVADGWAQADLTCAQPAWQRRIRLTGAATAPAAATPEGPGRQVAITTTALPRGHILGPRDVALGRVSDRVDAGSFDRAEVLVGRRLRQSLGRGQPVLARNLDRVLAVRAGQPARLRLDSGPVRVELSVVALEDGTEGQVIRARHPVSGREMRARVEGTDFLAIRPNTR